MVGQSGMGTRVFASSIAGGPVWGVHAAAWAEAREVVSRGVRGGVSGAYTLVYVCTCVEEFTYTKFDNCPTSLQYSCVSL